MTELDRISELESVLQDLLAVAGSSEDTKVIPNCEIIDNSPAGLPSNYIIVKDENAHNIPAIKVPGLSYITGEFVNVLKIRGTEAVAYQYGSGSSTDYTALLVESIQFNLTPTTTIEEGTLQWDADNGTLAFGLPGGNSILQIGQEVQFRAKCDEVSGISNGDVVYVSGASGGNPLVKIATSASYSTAYLSFGMATEDISYNQFGYVTFFGLVRELDTSSFAEGNVVWLDTDGSLTTTIPDAPNATTFVGVVLRSHATEGVIGVNPRTNPRIQDLSDVYAVTPSDGDVLQWDGTNNYWLPTASTFAGKAYVHTQSSASATWSITHSLGTENLVISVFDAADELVIADVAIVDSNNITVTHAAAETGKAVILSADAPFVDDSPYLLTDGTRAGSTSQAQDFGATGIKADTIAESTAAAGVTVDGVRMKDSEIYPQGDLRGIATRLINPLSFTLDDDHHFRADAIPTGYTWINPATGAGVTPAVLDYSLFNEYLYVSETTSGQRDFLQKTAAAYNGSQIYARLSCGFQGEIGLRVDDSANPTTNFCEIYVTGAPTGGLIQLAWRYNSSTPTTAFTIPAGQELNIRLYLLSGTQFFGYTFGSAGIAVNVFNSPSGLTWPGTAFGLGNLRAGLFYKHTGTLGNPATVDWFYSTFE